MHPTIGAALVFQGTHPPPQGPNPNRLRPCGAVEATLIMLKVISLGALTEKGC